MNAAELLPLLRVYDLRDPAARQAAHRHRGFWGKLYTDIHALDNDHIALVFRPFSNEAAVGVFVISALFSIAAVLLFWWFFPAASVPWPLWAG